MGKARVWLNVLVLSGILASLPANAEKGKEKEDKASYHSSIQAPRGKEISEKAEQTQLHKLARISEKDAVHVATGKAGSAKFLNCKLENEDGNVVYLVEFQAGTQVREIVVDAGNGKILSDRVEKADDKD